MCRVYPVWKVLGPVGSWRARRSLWGPFNRNHRRGRRFTSATRWPQNPSRKFVNVNALNDSLIHRTCSKLNYPRATESHRTSGLRLHHVALVMHSMVPANPHETGSGSSSMGRFSGRASSLFGDFLVFCDSHVEHVFPVPATWIRMMTTNRWPEQSHVSGPQNALWLQRWGVMCTSMLSGEW